MTKTLLLTELMHGYTQAERDSIFRDWEVGVQSMRLDLGLKLGQWQRLPLICHAIAYHDNATAVASMRIAKRLWEDRVPSDSFKEFPMCIFTDDEIASELDAWLSGAPMSPSVLDYSCILGLSKVDELSVEGLHRTASLLSRTAPHMEAAHLSFSMRLAECIEQFGVGALARAASGLNDQKITEIFELSSHPTIVRWAITEQARTGTTPTIGRNGSYKHIRSCFYHCDLFSMFDRRATLVVEQKYTRMKNEAKKVKDRLKKESQRAYLPDYKSLPQVQQAETLQLKHAMSHVQQRVGPTDILIFHRMSLQLAKVEHPAIKREPTVSQDGLGVEGLVADDIDLSWMAHNCPGSVFRIVEAGTAKRRKLMPGMDDTTLTMDLVAMVRYEVVSQRRVDKNILISQRNRDDHLEPEVLHMEDLVCIGLDVLWTKCCICDLDGALCYWFEKVLPVLANSPAAWNVVTCLVNAGAVYPAKTTWAQPLDLDPENCLILQVLKDQSMF